MKQLHEIIKDTYYPKTAINKHRLTAKGVILDENDNILFIHVLGNDIFGYRNHLELPGGGIEDNEDDTKALRREILEELGYSIKNIEPIGCIEIEYNLLSRVDEGHFYSARIDKYFGAKLLDYEKKIFAGIVKININDVISYYESDKQDLVGNMIQERDLIVLKEFLRKRERKNGNE